MLCVNNYGNHEQPRGWWYCCKVRESGNDVPSRKDGTAECSWAPEQVICIYNSELKKLKEATASVTKGRCKEKGKVHSHFIFGVQKSPEKFKTLMELPQKHSSQQRGKDECSEFLANSLEFHLLRFHSLFSLLANLQTLQTHGGVEVFLKYSLSEVDFLYLLFFPYRILDDNGIL